ncbi:hypothetical protein NKH77_11410 [Streptomyces sp. M19]
MGDALAAFNPIYGHGMSGAARSAVVLDKTLRAGSAPARPPPRRRPSARPSTTRGCCPPRRTCATPSAVRTSPTPGCGAARRRARNSPTSSPTPRPATRRQRRHHQGQHAVRARLHAPDPAGPGRRAARPRYQPHPEPPLGDEEMAVMRKGRAAYEARSATTA